MKISDSILANLLANERLTVQCRNVTTASFDVYNRVLTLPFWADASKDVTHLFIGHEVAHALYTPAEDLKTVRTRGGMTLPFSYLNIVEDIRIERKILAKYPGLLGNFKRGYKELFDAKEFFGDAKSIVRLPFPDRLNAKMKLRDLIKVPFTEEEKVLVEKARVVDTFEEMVEAAWEIYLFMRDQKNSFDEDPQEFMSDQIAELMEDLEDGSDESVPQSSGAPAQVQGDSDEDGDEEADSAAGAGSEEGDEDADSASSGSGDSDDSDEGDGEGDSDLDFSDLPEDMDINRVASQEALDAAAEETTEKHAGRIYGPGAGSLSEDPAYFSPEKIISRRESYISGWAGRKKILEGPEVEAAFREFTVYSDKAVNQMVAEFERRRSAARFARAETSRTGSLDTTKLHKYLLSDDIFATNTIVEDDKGHGMIILVDFSGSMEFTLPALLRRLLILVKFCKKAGIKFRVFSFTSSGTVEMFNDAMTKANFSKAVKQVFWMTVDDSGRISHCYRKVCNEEDTSSTPLTQTIFKMEEVFTNYLKDKSIQKCSFVTITDGISDGFYAKALDVYGTNTERFMGEIFDFYRSYSSDQTKRSSDQTKRLLDILRAKGFKTCNFYIAGGSKKPTFKNDIEGYDVKFFLPAQKAAVAAVEEVDASMSVAKIAKALSSVTDQKAADKMISREISKLIG